MRTFDGRVACLITCISSALTLAAGRARAESDLAAGLRSDDETSSAFADWPEPDRTPPMIMESRLSLGAQGGYGSPFGLLALDLDYYPVSWFGVEATLALPISAERMTTGEALRFGWALGDFIEQGLGLGIAISKVSAQGNSSSVDYLTADCGHFTFYFSRAVSFRVSLDLAFPVSGSSFCDQHPGACPHTTVISGNAAMFWNFDLSAGED